MTTKVWDPAPVKLTDAIVRALPAPTDRGYRIKWDTEEHGYGVRVTRAGAKSHILRDRVGRQERMPTIGSFPAWSVKQGREAARKLKQQFESGKDVVAEKRAKDTAPTVNDLADQFVAEYLPTKRPSTAVGYRRLLSKHIRPALGKMKVADVEERHIERMTQKITVTAPYNANRAHAVASKMFALSVRWKMRKDNPCRGVARNREHRREVYLLPPQIVRLGEVLTNHPNKPARRAVQLLLLTGARRTEVLGARWEEFDLASATWHKPRTRTKSGTDQRLPLSAPAVQLLVEMKAESSNGSPFLFPGRPGMPLTDIKHFWQRICDAAGLEGVRLHDLRHTHASILVSQGFSLPLIGALLGHTQPGTTARYAHLYDDPLREAVERVGAAIAGNGETAEVVPLRQRRS
jgi:integrase